MVAEVDSACSASPFCRSGAFGLGVERLALVFAPRDHPLAALRQRGAGPRFIRIGRAIRYRIADLDRWLDRVADADERRD